MITAHLLTTRDRASYYIARGALELARTALLSIRAGHLSGSMAAALRSQLDLAATTTPVDMALSRAATLRREALRVSLI